MLKSPQLRDDIQDTAEAGKRASVLSQVDAQVQIAGSGLEYSVARKTGPGLRKGACFAGQCRERKMILEGISVLFRPGRLTAVMGASGAGKTSLLYLMAGELSKQGTVSGRILVNGEPWDGRRVRQISGFVFQEDILLDTMTVREAVYMSATLRLRDTPEAERIALVDDLLKLLSLEHCADTMIGSSLKKGISGGERKRCAIAMELITNPPVLFLDEPTSGLDTFTAYQVVGTLQELAHGHGRTVIATIHQPSSDIYHLFDDLLLLAKGRVLYYGPADGAVGYFAARGHECPQYSNPADYFFMHLAGADARLLGAWLESAEHSSLEQTLALSYDPGPKHQEHQVVEAEDLVRKRARLHVQFWFLLRRAVRNAWRNRMVFQVKLLQNIAVGLLVGLIYYDTDSKSVPTQVQDRNGALYFIVVSQFFGASMGFVSVFSVEKAVFMREYGAGYYSIIPYFASKVLVEVPCA